MKPSWGFLLIGFIFFLVGIKIYFTGYVWTAQTPKSTAIFVIAFSIFIFFYGLMNWGKLNKSMNLPMICNKCGAQFKAKHVKISACPKCDGKLEFKKNGN